MHRDVRRELQSGRIGRDQAAFDLWREQYNSERPHEALGEVYRPSARAYEGTPEDLDYGGMETRRVNRRNGQIVYGQEQIQISTAVGGWSVGLSAREDGLREVWFSRLLLGHLDPTTASFKAARSGGLEAGQTKPEECNL